MKQLFINTVSTMVDRETIFLASPEYWGQIFDKLESGKTENIDQTFVTIYRTLKTAEMVQSNPHIQRLSEEKNRRRVLLSAIEERLKGKWVIVVCLDKTQVKVMEREFFRLVNMVSPTLTTNHYLNGNPEILNRGEIKFVSIKSSSASHFDWNKRRLMGMDIKDVVYIDPVLVNAHYAPILAEYKRNSSEVVLTDLMKSMESRVEMIDARRSDALKEKMAFGLPENG